MEILGRKPLFGPIRACLDGSAFRIPYNDNPHFCLAIGANQGVNRIDFLDQEQPGFPEWNIGSLRLQQAGKDLIDSGFFLLAPDALL